MSSAAKSPFLSVCPLTAVKSQDRGTEERPTCLFLVPRSHGAANTSQRPPWHPAQGTHPLPHCSHPSYLPVSAVDYVASSFTTSSLSQNKVQTPKPGLPGTSEHGPPHPCAPQTGGRTHHHPKRHTCSILMTPLPALSCLTFCSWKTTYLSRFTAVDRSFHKTDCSP